MPGLDAPSHWAILAFLVIALFGYKKLPDAARSIGRSLRVFKSEVKGMSEDDKAREAVRDPKTDSAGAAAVAAAVVPVTPQVTGSAPQATETASPIHVSPQGMPSAAEVVGASSDTSVE